MRRINTVVIFALLVVLLISCKTNKVVDSQANPTPATTVATPSVSDQPDPITNSPEQHPNVEPQNPHPDVDDPNQMTSPSSLDYDPAVRISGVLENGLLVIAECVGASWREEKTPSLYLLSDTIVCDILISEVLENEDGFIEIGGLSYIPELTAGQAVVLYDLFTFTNYYRVAYTNDAGNYESVLLFLDENEVPKLTPTDPKLMDTLFDSEFFLVDHDYYHSESGLLLDKLRRKAEDGDFDDYIPTGFCVLSGSLGDINNDGIEDALICLITDGYRPAFYYADTPLFVLIGQSDGSYIVDQKIPGLLFAPYKSSSYTFAGPGYIDIVYDYVNGASCAHIYANRFVYDPIKNDWLLKLMSYQPAYTMDWGERIAPAFVDPLHDLIDLPLGQFNRDLFYNSPTQWELFNEVSILTIPSYSDFNHVYTLAVKANNINGYYEGYIYMYFESINSGGFVQTLRGVYRKGTSLVVTSNDEERSFTINGDIWVLFDDDPWDAFHLSR